MKKQPKPEVKVTLRLEVGQFTPAQEAAGKRLWAKLIERAKEADKSPKNY